MTSLIFFAGYQGYKKALEHKQNKRRKANFERWEELRDEYEGAKRGSIQERQERPPYLDDASYSQPESRLSPQSTGQSYSASRSQSQPRERTGTASADRLWPTHTWDDGLPPPLRVERRSYDGDSGYYEGPSSRSNTSSPLPQAHPLAQSQSVPPPSERNMNASAEKLWPTHTWDDGLPPPLKVERRSFDGTSNHETTDSRRNSAAQGLSEEVLPTEWRTPGGPMAELLEREGWR